jgi:hypothetical protein
VRGANEPQHVVVVFQDAALLPFKNNRMSQSVASPSKGRKAGPPEGGPQTVRFWQKKESFGM